MPRCEILPHADHQVAILIDGQERTRWHTAPSYPRPFLYPLIGPSSGRSLTRMGHPGAADHDHHRSIWFAHNAVSGVDFWSDRTLAVVRQKQWFAYQDGDTEAIIATKLGWYDGHDPRELMEQELFISVSPGSLQNETLIELQSTFRPTAMSLELGKTNFGFLAVRMAKALSAAFGTGKLTNSDGKIGEPEIFGQRAKWVDYSGEQSGNAKEGITFFDHPTNPTHPCRWHVRDDGWMGASACFAAPQTITQLEPLVLRYLLHAHRGGLESKRAEQQFETFAKWTRWELVKAPAKHTQWGVRRRK